MKRRVEHKKCDENCQTTRTSSPTADTPPVGEQKKMAVRQNNYYPVKNLKFFFFSFLDSRVSLSFNSSNKGDSNKLGVSKLREEALRESREDTDFIRDVHDKKKING